MGREDIKMGEPQKASVILVSGIMTVPSRALKARKAERMGGGRGRSRWTPPHGEQKLSCSIPLAAEPGRSLPF